MHSLAQNRYRDGGTKDQFFDLNPQRHWLRNFHIAAHARPLRSQHIGADCLLLPELRGKIQSCHDRGAKRRAAQQVWLPDV
jgi:hypothetical protein